MGRVSSARLPWFRLLLIGLAGGVLSGMFGVGGGVVMVPLLINFAGVDERRASATSLAAIVPTAVVGCIAYAVNGRVDILAALVVAAGGVVGTWLGARLLRTIPLGVLRWTFVTVLVIVAIRMVLVQPEAGQAAAASGPLSIAGLVVLGLVIGVASGLLGIGGGILMVPAFVVLFGMGDLVAKGTSLAAMIPTSIVGTATNLRGGLVDWRAGIIVGIAATGASVGGAAIAFLLPPALSAILFAALLLFTAIQLAVRALRMRRRASAA